MNVIFIFSQSISIMLTLYMLSLDKVLISCVICGVISALNTLIYCYLHAPDIAITEAVIGTGASMIMFSLSLLYIESLRSTKSAINLPSVNIGKRVAILGFLCILVWLFSRIILQIATVELTVNSYKNIKISNYYLKNAQKDFNFPSIVTSIVAGYRAVDTLFESLLILVASFGFRSILIDRERE
jgi:uncharacterized MnhB-related membrane protein